MASTDPKPLKKHIRVLPEQWDRIERAARGTALTANQLVVTLAIEALDRRNWPATETEIRVARASLFAAQAISRDMKAAGREDEVDELLGYVSKIVPDNAPRPPEEKAAASETPDSGETAP